MADILLSEYTIWNEATREMYMSGRSVMDKAHVPDGHVITWGEALNDDFVLNGDGQPVQRQTPKPVDPAEISRLVNRERQRRIEAGKSFNGIKATGSDKDIVNLTNLALGAQLRLSIGDATLTTFRDGDNIDHELTPMEVIGLWQAASAHVSALYAASWAMKAVEPFPQDPADDAYWPS